MTLKKIEYFPGWDVDKLFGTGQRCPVCHGTNFTQRVPNGMVFYEECNAKFFIEGILPEVGVVIYCYPYGYTKLEPELNGPVKYYIDLSKFKHGQNYFWQKISETRGLKTLGIWGSFLKDKSKQNIPAGEELFFFSPINQALEEVVTPIGDPTQVQNNAAEIEKLYPEGYYFREQSEVINEDDGNFLHNCSSKKGEFPILGIKNNGGKE